MHIRKSEKYNAYNMNTFDISKVIELWHLDKEEVAKVVFPKVRFPVLAFRRVLKGEAELDTIQLGLLADYIGVPVTDLFGLDNWHGVTEDDCLTLTKGGYKVKFNNTFFIIYIDGKPICKNVGNFNVMTFNDFIEYINNQIKLYENGSNQN